MRYRAWLWMPAACLVAAGCEVGGPYVGVGVGFGAGVYAPYAVDYADVAYYDTGMMYGVYDPYYDSSYGDPVFYSASALEDASAAARAPAGPERAASAAAAAVSRAFSPRGCVTATVTGAAVELQFDDCTGPLGLAGVSGALTMTFVDGGGRLEVTATADELVVGKSTLNIDVTARYAFEGGKKVLEIHSRTSHADRPMIARDARFTMTWSPGSGCVAIDGQGTTTIHDVSHDVTMRGITRCEDRCPDSGTVTFTGASGTVEVSFDGTNTATMVSGGMSDVFALPCER